MTRSTAYVYKVDITDEDEDKYTVSVEFESSDQLSEGEQTERAEQILYAAKDDVETGVANMTVQPTRTVLIDTTTNITNGVTTTYTTKTYIEG